MLPRTIDHHPVSPPASAHRDRALQACLNGARALQIGSTAQALEHYTHAVSLAPDDAEIAALHGVALRGVARLSDAQREFIRAIALDPERADSYTQLAQTYRMAGDRVQAAQAFLMAATLRTHDAIVWRDAAESLRLADRFDDGLRAAQHAATLAPNDASIANTTALLLHRSGQLGDALELCERARATDPDDVHLALTHGMLYRTLGRHDMGWALYERRLELPAFTQRPFAPTSPRWDGARLDGRSILVRAEQGLGDQLHFGRWVTLLRARGAAQVIVQCATPLVRLLRTLPGVDTVVASDRPAPPHAVHVDCCSLPHLLRTGDEMFGTLVPYLHPSRADGAAGVVQPATPAGRFRLGIVWSGSPLQEDNRFRSIQLAQLLPAITRVDVEIVVLQQGPGRTQLDTLDSTARAALTDAAPACADMYDTALAAMQCDAVLSVCTSVVHLAGALGLPTWLMLGTPAEWRWGADGERTPLYPTMRLFRQQRAGDWSNVLDDVRTALSATIAARQQ
jgi:Flp pilus assembly protein TadD